MTCCPSCGWDEMVDVTETFTAAEVDEVFVDGPDRSGQRIRADFTLASATRCRRCGDIHVTYREHR